jgi:hypothetical protein
LFDDSNLQLKVIIPPYWLENFLFWSAFVSRQSNFLHSSLPSHPLTFFTLSPPFFQSAEFVIPAPCSHARLATRRLVNILLHFFEESPREGARVLGEIVFGTSRVHASMIVVEQILAQMLALPRPEHSAVYYESLMVSLCKNVKMIPPFVRDGFFFL